MLLERWDDFWSDTAWYHKPQHETLEVILAPDAASRFALLKSGQADMIVGVPFSVAAKLPRSKEFKGRGINPEQGDIWTQTIVGSGNMLIDFVNLMAVKDSLEPPTPEEIKPFDDIRVREALELAIDKQAISDGIHHGFSRPMTGLFMTGVFGYRPELEVSPYDPERAKELMVEAGYDDGFKTEVHFGYYGNSPGQRSFLEATASYWKEHLNVELEIFEYEIGEWARGFGFGQVLGERHRRLRPLTVQTFGREEHALIMVNYGYHATGYYNCCYDDFTEAKWKELQNTTDEAFLKKGIAEVEDYVLKQRWAIPMHEASMVHGYGDRVLAHPTAPHASSYEQLWRVVLRD